jgi:hypothetical protein
MLEAIMTSGIEPATFLLAAQRVNRMHYEILAACAASMMERLSVKDTTLYVSICWRRPF